MWGIIARGISATRRSRRNARAKQSTKLKRKLATIEASKSKWHIDSKSRILSKARARNILHSQINEAQKKEARKPKQTIISLTKHEARRIIGKKIAKNPFSAVIDKERFCKERKRKREEILRKTGGKGLKIKRAIWTPISKLIKCERKK